MAKLQSGAYRAAHLLDENPLTAWASNGTPMPHWAEITLPEPAAVHAVEWTARQGPYIITDTDIEVPAGDGWRVVKAVRAAKERKVMAKLDTPVTTTRVRVKILRELLDGGDRTNADVASIRVLDAAGRNVARAAPAAVRVTGAFEARVPPSAVAVATTTAEVLGRFERAGNEPAVLRNRLGRGAAMLVACDTVPDDATFWTELCRVTLGEPAYRVDAKAGDRFRLTFTRVGDARVLHVIDAEVPARGYRPESVEVSLAAALLGGRSHATLAGGDREVPVREEAGRRQVVVQPNPVATVVFRGRP